MPFKYATLQARLLANSKPMRLHEASSEPGRAWTTQPCRIWAGKLKNSGYGELRVRARLRYRHGKRKGQRKVKSVAAHRQSLALHLRLPVWALNHVLHLCDNKPCIEPTHLYSSTQLKNVRDCVAKGRHRNGATGKLSNETLEKPAVEPAVAGAAVKPLSTQGKEPVARRGR